MPHLKEYWNIDIEMCAAIQFALWIWNHKQEIIFAY